MNYNNPIIHKDFSDPDVIRDGDDFYMVSSSFNYVPGVPILHSTDLINWVIVNYIIRELPKRFDNVLHGNGVWAPAIRKHNEIFYCFIPFPDEGIYVAKTNDILGKWEMHLLNPTKGMIDPCPIWVDDKVYVVCAFAKSIIGFNSVIGMFETNTKCDKLLTDYKIIFDGNNTQPVIEGPKIYYINKYYYILAPAGSVKTGWQCCLRSKNIYGPYEDKIVMMQSDTIINGPHQGALIKLKNNDYWFIHFQSKDIYGRIVHLQPVSFINDWPIIGIQTNNTGKPVLIYKAPDLPHSFEKDNDYSNKGLENQWQFPANNKGFYSIDNKITLKAVKRKSKMFYQPNLLLQMVEYELFTIDAHLTTIHDTDDCLSGLIVFGIEYAYIGIKNNYILLYKGSDIAEDMLMSKVSVNSKKVFLRIEWEYGLCSFYYSLDDDIYHKLNYKFLAKKGVWVGTKIGLFCVGDKNSKVTIEKYNIENKQR